jgi:acyl-CoA hydrolase
MRESEHAAAPVAFPAGPHVHLDEWVAPDLADEEGCLRAGKLLEWLDVVGALAATRHCRRPVVTVAVDGLDLRFPLRVGERVTMSAVVAYTSERSMGVAVEIRHGDALGRVPWTCVEAWMTFVAMDDEGRPQPVPQVSPVTPVEARRFGVGKLRRELRVTHAGDAVLAPEDGRSYMHKIEPVRAGKLNFHGTLYGGTLMRWVETTANLSARADLGNAPVRLRSLQGLTFLRPVEQHTFVHVRAQVVHASDGALTVFVTVEAEHPLDGRRERALRAFLTFVPLDERIAVGPMVCTSEEETVLCDEAERRLALERRLAVTG